MTLKKPLTPEDKTNTYIGTLLGLSEDTESVLIEVNEISKSIEFKNIKTVRLEG